MHKVKANLTEDSRGLAKDKLNASSAQSMNDIDISTIEGGNFIRINATRLYQLQTSDKYARPQYHCVYQQIKRPEPPSKQLFSNFRLGFVSHTYTYIYTRFQIVIALNNMTHSVGTGQDAYLVESVEGLAKWEDVNKS